MALGAKLRVLIKQQKEKNNKNQFGSKLSYLFLNNLKHSSCFSFQKEYK